jgi:hypothetical protein
MLAAPLFLTTLALAPTGASSRFELTVQGEYDNEVIAVPQRGTAGSNGGDGSVGFTLFFDHPIIDDDAPPGLQPFLQRLSSLHVWGEGGGYQVLPTTGSPLPAGSGYGGDASLSGSVYADRFFFASLGVGVDYRSDTSGGATTPRLEVPLGISAGPRIGDTLLTIGWSLAPTRIGDSGFQIPFWGNVNLQVVSVLGRALSLHGEVDLYDGGAGAVAGLAVFIDRRLGVGGFVRGSYEHVFDTMVNDAHVGAGLEVDVWSGPRLAFELAYTFDWNQYHDADSGAVTETDYRSLIDLTMRLRPR